MTRYASSTNQTEGDKVALVMFIACALDFTSGMVRAHNGLGTLNWSSNDYLGVGSFGGIELAEESIDFVARAVTLTLSGVDSSLITTAGDATVYQGRTATLYLGFVNPSTNALVDTPETLWEGRMNQMTVNLGQESSIRLTCEHRMRREPRMARYTNADLQLAYSGDRFFDLVPKIPGFHGLWGSKGIANDGSDLSRHYADIADKFFGGGS